LTATNGADALKICAKGDCDIVLLDARMPGMDGLEVCRRLKGDALASHIPIVMVTALNQPSDRLCGPSAGADDFLSKPVGPDAASRAGPFTFRLRSRALQSAKVRRSVCRCGGGWRRGASSGTR
jgi:two-component system, cell cycle response regulator